MTFDKFKIIISKPELGAGTYGASLGPEAIKIAFYEDGNLLFRDSEVDRINYDTEHIARGTKDQVEYFRIFPPLLTRVATVTADALKNRYKCLFLSGDHSNAIGFVAGIKKAFPGKRLGVVWLDAHGDLHTPYTSPSLNVHGMTLGAMLGLGSKPKRVAGIKPAVHELWQKIISLGGAKAMPMVLPQDVVFLGIRDLEEPEWKLIRKHRIKYFRTDDIQKLGANEVVAEVKEHLKNCDLIYLSFDADVLDPSISRGTGTPVRNGLTVAQVEHILKPLYHLPQTCGLEVTEVNPLLDVQNHMGRAVARILQKVL